MRRQIIIIYKIIHFFKVQLFFHYIVSVKNSEVKQIMLFIPIASQRLKIIKVNN